MEINVYEIHVPILIVKRPDATNLIPGLSILQSAILTIKNSD